jgi:hypothetical protein
MTTAAPSERPGWVRLQRAADELHAAELLIGDPLAAPRTALPHLRAFWVEMVAAGIEAGLSPASEPPASPSEPEAWLHGCQIAGLDARDRAALLEHWRTLQSTEVPDARALRAHTRAARGLLRLVEPIIGGVALYTRKRRALWATIGVSIVLLPILAYTAVKADITGDGPWRATYFSDRKLEEEIKVMRELDMTHDWGKDAPFEDLPPDKFSVRWDTCLRIDESKTVTFLVNANDAARVLIDGQVVIDAWEKTTEGPKRGFGSVELPLEAGIHHLRVEYFESLGSASIKFAASFDGEVPVAIPNERLAYPGDNLDEDEPCAAVQQ